MTMALLALGANLGERETNLRAAIRMLPPAVHSIVQSSVFETEPQYVAQQPRFLNMALQATTELEPIALLEHLKSIEQTLGREPTVRFGPRLIDLDILFYGDEIVALPGLTIPHPRLAERAFVLRPLAQIAAEFVHPVLKRSVAQLLSALPDTGAVVLSRQALD